MSIEADILAIDYMWCQIHAGAKQQSHKSICGTIQPTNIEYHNITYTITSHLAKNISKHRSLKYWSSHNRDISNVITDMSVFQHVAKNLPIWKRWWM